jgi:hypothetical protein
MLKSLRSALLLATTLLPLLLGGDVTVKAQERQGCFMVNSSGQLLDLSEICPSPEPFAAAEGEPTLGTGDIQVTLRWTSVDDLDLAVTDPAGQIVYYANPSVASGGQLDVDANAGCGESDSSPIENIFWPPSQAPQGQYVASVNLFTRCSGGISGPISFEMRILVQGEVQTLTGTVSDDSLTANFPFTLPPQ